MEKKKKTTQDKNARRFAKVKKGWLIGCICLLAALLLTGGLLLACCRDGTPRVAHVIAYTVEVDLEGVAPEDMRDVYLQVEARAHTIAAAQGEEAFLSAIEADLRATYPTLSEEAIELRVKSTYRYNILETQTGLVENWACDIRRQAGDIEVLGETGHYTVVYCLSPLHTAAE